MGNEISPWIEKMKALGQATAANEVVTGKFFSIKSGILSYDGRPMPGNEFVGIVIANCAENHFYSKPFNAMEPVGPDCYAFGKTKALDSPVVPPMVPHDKAPNKQHATCEGCPKLAWGTDIMGGKGKGCKEIRRLALIAGDATKNGAEAIAGAPVAYLRVPLMSVRNWASYVQLLSAKGTAPMAVFTKITVKPDARAQFTVNFELMGPVADEDMLAALWEKAEQAHATIDFPYMDPEGEKGEAPKQQAKRNAKM